jgi:hypothetical protein
MEIGEIAPATEIDIACNAVWRGELESATLTAKLNEPDLVGVPLMTPLAARLSPAGNCPEAKLQLYGAVPPDALRAHK